MPKVWFPKVTTSAPAWYSRSTWSGRMPTPAAFSPLTTVKWIPFSFFRGRRLRSRWVSPGSPTTSPTARM